MHLAPDRSRVVYRKLVVELKKGSMKTATNTTASEMVKLSQLIIVGAVSAIQLIHP